ncbi:GNAT family N-acetyltransferase [Aquimarina longa]|uniref:GNAT family N-acetyltransferase n=1 Tax=Aquimarina longa TaxID=1080221 RepID=UPI0007804AB4|nr:GNAT family N-acetyltransferase [Aquimarina longa]
MKKIELIKAQESDKDFLFRLRKLTMDEHLKNSRIHLSDEEHLSRVNFEYENAYVLSLSAQRVGMLKHIEKVHYIEIIQLQILPEYQGQGIGKSVLKDIITEAKALGKSLKLKVLKENPARYLYERSGFSIIGEDQYEFDMQLLYIK